MSQQTTLSAFEPSVIIHLYREKIIYRESEEGCKCLARWEAKIFPAKAQIKIRFIRVCDLPRDKQKEAQKCFQAWRKILDGASRYHVLSSLLLSGANLSLGDAEKSRSYSKKDGHRFPLVGSLEFKIKRFQSIEDGLSKEEKRFVSVARLAIKNHFPNATEKEKKAPIHRNGFVLASTQIV